MPLYTFELHDGSCRITDDDGIHLTNREQALCYAYEVVREMMNHRERDARTWRLDVYEDCDQLFEIPFVRLDETLDHLDPRWRSIIEDHCARRLSLSETYSAARVTMREARALVARSRGKPYLAADRGQSTIREH